VLTRTPQFAIVDRRLNALVRVIAVGATREVEAEVAGNAFQSLERLRSIVPKPGLAARTDRGNPLMALHLSFGSGGAL
jgi:hypothetical protein